MNLVKVQAGTATRGPVPEFLLGLAPESLADLSWVTDPKVTADINGAVWWPIVDHSPPLLEGQQYGAETLVPNPQDQTVIRLQTIVPRLPTELEYLAAVDAMLSEGAARKRYDSIHSAALRAGYAGPFHDEGVAYATWMDSVYSSCYTIMAQVKAGTQAPPATTGALLDLLPRCPFPPDPASA